MVNGGELLKAEERLRALERLSQAAEFSIKTFHSESSQLAETLRKIGIRSPFYYFYDCLDNQYITDEKIVSAMFREQEPKAFGRLFGKSHPDDRANPYTHLHGVGTSIYLRRIMASTAVLLAAQNWLDTRNLQITFGGLLERLYKTFDAIGQQRLLNELVGDPESKTYPRTFKEILQPLEAFQYSAEDLSLDDEPARGLVARLKEDETAQLLLNIAKDEPLMTVDAGCQLLPELAEKCHSPTVVPADYRLDNLVKYAVLESSEVSLKAHIDHAESILREIAPFASYGYGIEEYMPKVGPDILRQNQMRFDTWLINLMDRRDAATYFDNGPSLSPEQRRQLIREYLESLHSTQEFASTAERENYRESWLRDLRFDPVRIKDFSFLDMLVVPITLNNSLRGLFLAEYIGSDFQFFRSRYLHYRPLFHQLALPPLIEHSIADAKERLAGQVHLLVGTSSVLDAHAFGEMLDEPLRLLQELRNADGKAQIDVDRVELAIDLFEALRNRTMALDTMAKADPSHPSEPFSFSDLFDILSSYWKIILMDQKVRLEDKTDIDDFVRLRSHLGSLAAAIGLLIMNSCQAYSNIEDPSERPLDKFISIDCRCENGDVIVEIEDKAGGLPEETELHFRQRNWEKVSTRTGDGGRNHGQGLRRVYQCVVGPFSGRIDVHSETGVGTKWVLSLPRLDL